MNTAYLILADGSWFQGRSFGFPAISYEKAISSESADKPGLGEVVFNTSMSGYHEIITDPSYTGQIVLMTYPHIGNYGTDAAWSETGPEQEPGRKVIKAQALVVRDFYEGPVGPGRKTLSGFLTEQEIPGLSDIDTRALTLSLRDNGSRNGIIVSGSLTGDQIEQVARMLRESPAMEGLNLIRRVGITSTIPLSSEGRIHFGLIDCGTKYNIARELIKRDVRVSLFPSNVTEEEIVQSGADAVLLSNGPGDPGVLDSQRDLVRQLLGRLPIYGICLGHQIIGRALGADTYKMKFGHHGANHPVRDEQTKKVFVTSQNHGFAVDAKTLPDNVAVWFTNANDGSVEGLVHLEHPVMSVQFHPEAAPGPHDGRWIFDRFIQQAEAFHANR